MPMRAAALFSPWAPRSLSARRGPRPWPPPHREAGMGFTMLTSARMNISPLGYSIGPRPLGGGEDPNVPL